MTESDSCMTSTFVMGDQSRVDNSTDPFTDIASEPVIEETHIIVKNEDDIIGGKSLIHYSRTERFSLSSSIPPRAIDVEMMGYCEKVYMEHNRLVGYIVWTSERCNLYVSVLKKKHNCDISSRCFL
ncbi:uncharacterized protein LOC126904357 isoform X2 [Daktulosphaira vitifoliae]|uniref:uncharacterized protein LOC126904357 isoform X2 n=1 Tax=Daktulosphaira vitifoliae TaxID=58002 RepID=UPI0021AA438C|nr:uncharacterized protein LOC126904357 isoform X2 [Daktulosphaira vitifoliae]